MGELKSKGIAIPGEPEDEGWGITVMMKLPGGLEVMLYQPRHPVVAKRPVNFASIASGECTARRFHPSPTFVPAIQLRGVPVGLGIEKRQP